MQTENTSQNGNGGFIHEREHETTLAHSLGAGADGKSRRTICAERDPCHHRRGIFGRAIFCRGRDHTCADGWTAEFLLLSDEVPDHGCFMAGPGALPCTLYRDQSQSDLCSARRNPQTLHGKADPHAAWHSPEREQRRSEEHSGGADRQH